MTNDEQLKALADNLAKLASLDHRVGWYGRLEMAAAILKDPQGHVDALLEAGVLKCSTVLDPGPGPSWSTVYRVVQPEPPHEHVFYLGHASPTNVPIYCRGCDFVSFVPNKLPISIPEGSQ